MSYFTTMFWRLVGTILLAVVCGIVGDPTIGVILFIVLIVLVSKNR